MKRDIHIVINKSEITAGTRGATLGPEAMMAAAWNVVKNEGTPFVGSCERVSLFRIFIYPFFAPHS